MLNITPDDLYFIARGGTPTIVASIVPFLNQFLDIYKINTTTRMKHFFGQASEESASWRTLVEYASGKEYENRKDLGNIKAGDGVKYKGRGIFQLTGRSNYDHIGKLLGLDLVNHPELAATPEVAVQTACIYWQTHNLNAIADSSLSFNETVLAITKKINGGINGLAVRTANTLRAQTRFAVVPVKVVPVVPVTPVAPTFAVVSAPIVIPATSVFPETVNKPVVSNVEEPPGVFTQVVNNVDTSIKKFF